MRATSLSERRGVREFHPISEDSQRSPTPRPEYRRWQGWPRQGTHTVEKARSEITVYISLSNEMHNTYTTARIRRISDGEHVTTGRILLFLQLFQLEPK